MNETDQERFKRHSREKIEKLKNPNISVSDKRIVLKYLDKDVTEQQIKETTHEFLSVNNLPPKQLNYVPHHLLSANWCSTTNAKTQQATLSSSLETAMFRNYSLNKWPKTKRP